MFKPRELINKPNNSDEGTFIFTGEVKIQKTEIWEYNWFTYKETLKLEMAFSFKEHLRVMNKNSLI